MVTPQGNLHLSSMSDFFQGLYTLVVQSGSGATARSVFVSLGGKLMHGSVIGRLRILVCSAMFYADCNTPAASVHALVACL